MSIKLSRGTYLSIKKNTHSLYRRITPTEKQETYDMNSSAKIATYLGPNHSGDSTMDSSSDDGDTGLTNNQGKL